MKIKESLSPLLQTTLPSPFNGSKNIVGKVFGVVTNENTPTNEMFKKVGGWNGLGCIFYMEYDQSSNFDQIDLNDCKVAKPLFPNQKYYPLIGELVILLDLPGAGTQLIDKISEKYYIIPINLWNNNHHNAQPSSDIYVFGKTFNEKINVNTLQPFEGDYILEGRFGSAIRFGSTVRDINKFNQWSNTGNEGDPITIIANGYNFNPKSTSPYTEDINKDASSILLTSTQTVPLKTDKIKLNVLTKPISLDKYSDAQLIFNSDRVVLNSKKDDVLVFAKKNIELYTRNIINLNAEDRVHINSPKVFLGSKKNGDLPDEPLLLGDKTVEWMNEALKEICNFTSILSKVVSSPEGTPLLQINQASQILSVKLEELISRSEDLKSSQNYTV